jgi:small redox-active disulfide protein 2
MRKLQVLGTGCAKCRLLTERAEDAARGLGLEYTLEKVTDIDRIVSFGVMTTPALVVDGAVVVTGHVPSVQALQLLLV